MEWKKKFYDIVRETETNLIKARRKLYGHGTIGDIEETCSQDIYKWKPFSSSTALHSTPAPVSWLPSPWKNEISTTHHQLELSPASASARSSWEVQCLLDKIDAQNQVIHKMERLVRSLDKEREEYRRQIQELQSEVGGIVSHLNVSRTSDLQMETQVDLMKREVMEEIKRLKNMLLEGRSATAYSSLLEKGVANDIRDIKQNIHDELNRVQQEVNQIKRRLGKLELDITAHDVSQGDIHDRLEWNLPDLHQGHNSSRQEMRLQREYSSPLNPVNAVQIEHLRSTVSSLHDKLDRLEGRLASSASPMLTNGSGSSPWHQQTSKVPLVDLDENSSDASDLDLSVDLDGSLSSNNEPLSDEFDKIWTRSENVCEPKSLPASVKSWKTETKLQAPSSVRVSDLAAEISKDADLDLDTDDLNIGTPVDLDLSSPDNTFDLKFDDV